MDAFLSKKRRRLSPPPSARSVQDISALSAPDDDSTDFKLALLSSLHPFIEQNVLLDILLAHEGSVTAASASLENPVPSSKKSSSAATSYQSSLSNFIASNNSSEFHAKRIKPLSKKGKTLHLYSPEDVSAHTPCSIIHNFLPAEEANSLLEELLKESVTFERQNFKLFDNVVQSPHTACFYVESSEEMQRQKSEYIYNGGRLTDIRQLTAEMLKVSPKVEAAVNTEASARIKSHYPKGQKLRYQAPLPWRPNAAFVNCYNGGTESVGYHSDQLTYLGPHAIIGSISLGVAREFRVRRVVPQEDEEDDSNSESAKSKEDVADRQGQIAIHLPHNSFLIMHAEMQEEWKHSIAPAQSIIPHPISGNRRINITYRDYKEYLHPSLTPRCKCGVPCVLRVVQRKKESLGKYFWMCYAGNLPEKGKEGCSFFEWAHFDENGKPLQKSKVAD